MTYFNEFGQARLGWNVGTPSGGGGSTVDADAQAFITAANITDSTQQSAINTLVTQLKTYGIWSKMKALYPFVGGTATSHKFNLKDPRDVDAAYRLVFNGGWTHSSTGALPNGTTAYADTKLIPNANLTQWNTHLSYYSRTSTKINTNIEMGSYDSTSINLFCLTLPRSNNVGGSVMYSQGAQSDMANIPAAGADSFGFFIGTRTSNVGNSHKLFLNQNIIGTASTSAGVLLPNPLYIGALRSGTGVGYFSNKETAFSSIGDGLTDAEAANFYTAVQTFQTTLGRHVGVPIVADSDAQAFLNAAVITNQTQANAINTLVTSLKSANIWTKMKAIYPFVGGTASTHKFNLKDPRDLDAAYRLNFFGGGSHSATGWKPNASNAYAELGSLNMNTISPIDYSLGVYLRTDAASGVYYDFGATNNVDTGWYMMNARGGINQINYQAGSINVAPAGSNTNSQGFYQAVANSNNLTKVFKNGSVVITSTTTQTKTPFNQVMNIGRAVITTGGAYYSTREQGFFYVSTGLTDAEIVSVRTAVYNYQNALGRLAE